MSHLSTRANANAVATALLVCTVFIHAPAIGSTSDDAAAGEPCGNLTQLGARTSIYNGSSTAWNVTFTTYPYALPFFRTVNPGVVKYLDHGQWQDVGVGDKKRRRIYKFTVPPRTEVPIAYCADRSKQVVLIEGDVELNPVAPQDNGPVSPKSMSFTGMNKVPRFDVRDVTPYFRFNGNDVNTLDEDGSIVICPDAECLAPSPLNVQ